MIVKMYMTPDVETVSPETSVADAITKMKKHHIRRLIVVSDTKIKGMVSEQDLMKVFPHHVNPFSASALEESIASSSVKLVMKSPAITIEESEPIENAAALITSNRVGGLPVTLNNKLVGIITESDIFRALTKILMGEHHSIRITFDVTENEDVLSYLAQEAKKFDLNLLSFISFHHQEKRLVVARLAGNQIRSFIDKLWESGHIVENIVETNKPA
jgi:acetoin utilization protein AcuB